MAAELRKYPRFRAKEGALAAFAASDHGNFSVVGEIIDISSGGLSFRYLPSQGQPAELPFMEIIGYREPRVRLEKLPCKVIYDSEEPDPFGFGVQTRTKRCGVQFGALSQGQRSQLEDFVKSYAESSPDV